MLPSLLFLFCIYKRLLEGKSTHHEQVTRPESQNRSGTVPAEPCPPKPAPKPVVRNLLRKLPGTRESEPAPEPSWNPWFGTCRSEPALEPPERG